MFFHVSLILPTIANPRVNSVILEYTSDEFLKIIMLDISPRKQIAAKVVTCPIPLNKYIYTTLYEIYIIANVCKLILEIEY